MPYLLQYLLKFSISLVVLFGFYRFILLPLTFYQWNRFYLLCYSLLSFVIPFVDVTPWMLRQGVGHKPLVNIIPLIDNYTVPSAGSLLPRLNISISLIILFCLGMLIMLVRIVVQYLSLRQIRRNAVPLNFDKGIRLFQTRAPVSPFTFGKSIYLNPSLHTAEELQRIIEHEFVHVKQRHTLDLMVAELLCIVNWYNPFAWLIRNAIRQNLEFIADNKVVENGLDKKEYQYLLLKVVGISKYSIASNFNFSNLKKRIAMMNKIKSARLHLTKFLFALPLLAVLLLAFRNNNPSGKITLQKNYVALLPSVRDTIPTPKPASSSVKVEESVIEVVLIDAPVNNKGYFIEIINIDKQSWVLVRDKNRKEVKKISLATWNKNRHYYESLYGELPAPPPPPPKVVPPAPPAPAVTVPEPGVVVTVQNRPESRQQAAVEPVSKVEPGKVVINKVSINYVPAKNSNENPPLFVIDGVAQAPGFSVNELHANDIESINVLKNEAAVKRYGEKGKNGVILITKKIRPAEYSMMDTLTLVIKKDSVIEKNTIETKGGVKIGLAKSLPENLLYYINGKVETKENVERLIPDQIKSVNVLKGAEAIKKYGEKGKNGAIEIQTK